MDFLFHEIDDLQSALWNETDFSFPFLVEKSN